MKGVVWIYTALGKTLTPTHLLKALLTWMKGENTNSLEAALPIVSSISGHVELVCAGV